MNSRALAAVTLFVGAMIGYGIPHGQVQADAPIIIENCTHVYQTNITYLNCSCPDPTPEWVNMIYNFSQDKTYDAHNYNCADYSREAVQMLRQAGYDAVQARGKCSYTKPPYVLHSWVKICFEYEPQTGEEVGDICQENN